MKFLKFALPLLAVLSAASVNAKTIVYNLKDFNINNAQARYDNMPFQYQQGVANAVLTLSKENAGDDRPYLDSLVISFPDLEKLVVRNFRKIDNQRFRATVANTWIYKEVIIEVETGDWRNGHSIDINAFVSEKGTFLDRDSENRGLRIFQASGILRDQTPTRVADIEKTVLDGKSISLSLRDRLVPISDSDDHVGFLVNTSWLGHGTKDILVRADAISAWNVDDVEGIAILISTGNVEGPSIKVKYRRKGYSEYEYTEPQVLRNLLTESYEPAYESAN